MLGRRVLGSLGVDVKRDFRTRYVFVRDGCATMWDKCPNVDPITVRRADKHDDYQTECAERGSVLIVEEEPE